LWVWKQSLVDGVTNGAVDVNWDDTKNANHPNYRKDDLLLSPNGHQLLRKKKVPLTVSIDAKS